MHYLINGVVTFNPVDYTLISSDKSVDMLTLSRISSELLQLFIASNEVPLTRESILSELWEKRGLNASSNNLNNYVSMLRKALTHCGCESVITTIPKHGFIFSAEITLLPQTQKKSTIPATAAIDLTEVPIFFQHNAPASRRLIPTWFALLSIVALLLTGAISYKVYDNYRLDSLRTEIYRSDQCRFWLIDDLTRRKSSGWIISRIKEIMKAERVNCRLPANIYFSSDKLLDSRGVAILHEVFSYCAYNSKAPCENYTYARYEGDNE